MCEHCHAPSQILVSFSDQIKGVHVVSDPESARNLIGELTKVLSPLGGTDINLALAIAFEMSQKVGVKDARILLVTDGTEGIDVKNISKKLKETKNALHAVCIAGEREDLKKVSTQYDQLG